MWCEKARYCERNIKVWIKDILKMDQISHWLLKKSKVNILFVYKCSVKKNPAFFLSVQIECNST